MSHPKRLILPGYYYHTYTRAVNNRKLFLNGRDCRIFETLIDQAAARFEIDILVHTCMLNHVHLILKPETEPQKVSNFYNSVKSRYTRHAHKNYKSYGHLFAERFKAKVLKTELDLFRACVYVHANPVTKGYVDKVEDWPFSNFKDFISPEFWEKYKGTNIEKTLNHCRDYTHLVTKHGLEMREERKKINPNYTETINTELLFF